MAWVFHCPCTRLWLLLAHIVKLRMRNAPCASMLEVRTRFKAKHQAQAQGSAAAPVSSTPAALGPS